MYIKEVLWAVSAYFLVRGNGPAYFTLSCEGCRKPEEEEASSVIGNSLGSHGLQSQKLC